MYTPSSTDIIVQLAPSRSTRDESTATMRVYDAFVYTELPLQIGRSETRRVAEEYRGLPLRGTGHLRLAWRRYQDHLASFQEGEKGVERLRIWMQEALSPELEALVRQVRNSSEPLRVWWASDAPELDDMPWEALFYGQEPSETPAPYSFVRGVPPEASPPTLPLTGPIRLLWHDVGLSPAWMRELFRDYDIPGVSKIPFSGALREGISQAVHEGIELIHFSSDGIVSLAYEGVLYQREDRRPELSAHELSDRLGGSRVSVIGLTEEQSKPDTMMVNDREVVSVYRAFACFGSSKVPLPSMVAPLGPTSPDVALKFWKTFYTELASSYRLDKALSDARWASSVSPFALFLRHAHRRLFRAPVSQESSAPPPERMAYDLNSSLDITQRVRALGKKYGDLPDYLNRFAEEEGHRQKSVEAELDVWSRLEGDDK